MYLCGVKKIILDVVVDCEIHEVEFVMLKEWVYFHEVLARYSLLHWFTAPENAELCWDGPMSESIKIAPSLEQQVSFR